MPRPLHTHLTLYALDTAVLSESWWPDTISSRLSNAVLILLKYFTTWKLRLNTHKTVTILFSKHCPLLPDPFQIQDTFVPWVSAVHYLGLMLYSKLLLFTQHLHTIANRATGVFCNIFSLLAQDSVLTQSNKLTLYKLFIRSILTYAVPVWSSTCCSNYLRLPVIQSKYL
jgi:hypothetical protein